jgi:muramoyltetrapeptide carboxypeptidase
VKSYPSTIRRLDYTAGTGAQRAKDLTEAFADPDISAVIALRGGFGAAHTIPHLDLRALGKTRKPFIGYSDLTALLNPIATLGGLVTFHGPTANFFLRKDEPTQRSQAILQRFLAGDLTGLSYRKELGPDFNVETIRSGNAEGVLVGGNLSVLTSLIGTPYAPRAKDMILFIEEIGEKAYRLDRMLTQLIQSGFTQNVRGIVIGHLTDCGPASGDQDDALSVVKRVLAPLKVPTLAGFPAGHERPNFVLPIGARVQLRAGRGDLVITGESS